VHAATRKHLLRQTWAVDRDSCLANVRVAVQPAVYLH